MLANTHLALTGLHALDLGMAQRLFVAEWALNRGMASHQLLKIAGLRKEDDDEDDSESDDSADGSDFDDKHPRWVAGSPGGIGGEFAPKDASDATSALHEAIGRDATGNAPFSDGTQADAASSSPDSQPSTPDEGRVDESYSIDAVIAALAALGIVGGSAVASLAARIRSALAGEIETDTTATTVPTSEETASNGDVAATDGEIKEAVNTGQLMGSLDNLTTGEKLLVQEELDAGNNVTILNANGDTKTADVLVNGIETEFKTLNASGPNTLKNAIEEAAEQGNNIITDTRNTDISLENAKQQILRAEGNIGGLKGRVTVKTIQGNVTY